MVWGIGNNKERANRQEAMEKKGQMDRIRKKTNNRSRKAQMVTPTDDMAVDRKHNRFSGLDSLTVGLATEFCSEKILQNNRSHSKSIPRLSESYGKVNSKWKKMA
jgi:hypothetical protein